MKRQGECEKFVGESAFIWLYRAGLAVILAAGTLSFCGFPFDAVEYIVLIVAYLLIVTVLHGIYGACCAGQSRIPELVLSQTLSNLMTLAVLYVGTALYLHALFNPLAWLAVLAAQEAWSIVWSLLANARYYKHYVSPRAAILYQDEAALRQLYDTPFFEKKYDVRKRIQCTGVEIGALKQQLADCEVVFAADVSDELVNKLAKFCVDSGKQGFFLPRIGQIILSGATYVSAFSTPMLAVQRVKVWNAYRVVKRLFDIAASLAGIVLTLPVMLLTALVIHLEDRGPVLYRQTRLTEDGRAFSILKFRSMTVDAEKDGVARLAGRNDQRITRVGRWIRACRIDELPQLVNILAGDMSLVGPRPERPEIAREYERELPEFALRLQVKAGLTGLAQVYGRYNTDPYSKLKMDLMYINRMSPIEDLYLILATVKTVFMKDGAEGFDSQMTFVDSQPSAKTKSA